ncbi:hypothetical protein [uncultured Nostoc sp.]|uniref:hypothetical protein n=1 Tax=uncultured Nostoc sp. TaxID=340711 RepID=UPI0035CB7628
MCNYQFPEEASGSGVILPCDIVPCGKFRNGAQRWWCRTHQVHWGDLGDFAKNPHKKHFCGNCGVDSNWSKEPIVSSPLNELANKLTKNPDFVESDRTLDLRNYQECQAPRYGHRPQLSSGLAIYPRKWASMSISIKGKKRL